MKPQSCKQKGRRFQQEIVETVKDSFPVLRDNDVKSVSMGAGGEDVIMSPLAESIFPYSIECKNVEKINIWKSLEQASANAPRQKIPVLAMKKNRTKPHAVIPWEHFMSLTKKSHELDQLLSGPRKREREVIETLTCARCEKYAKLQDHMKNIQQEVDTVHKLLEFVK